MVLLRENPEITDNTETEENDASVSGETVLEDAVSIRIGQGTEKVWSINMYDNAAVDTMLGYLSNSELLFPTYTYSDADGLVGQNIRGRYTRDDEILVTDIKAGELYLFSDGQLRLYFKDISGANITATPVGYVAEADGITEAVQNAYESNLGDSWGVDVYFLIKKNN